MSAQKLNIILDQLELFMNEYLLIALKKAINEHVNEEKEISRAYKPSENLSKIIENCKNIKTRDAKDKAFKALYVKSILKTIDKMDASEFKINN